MCKSTPFATTQLLPMSGRPASFAFVFSSSSLPLALYTFVSHASIFRALRPHPAVPPRCRTEAEAESAQHVLRNRGEESVRVIEHAFREASKIEAKERSAEVRAERDRLEDEALEAERAGGLCRPYICAPSHRLRCWRR